jgi:hypothetical protein
MRHRKLAALSVAAAAMVAGTGCLPNPVLEGNAGFLQARNRTGTITVDNRTHQGVPAEQIVNDWNTLAGRTVLVALPRGAAAGATANVRFNMMSPICANGNCNDRRAAWVQPTRNPDGSYAYCTIHFDPWIPALPSTWENVMEHELGHCLGFISGPYVDTTHADYKGAMSYWNFASQAGWWGAADVEMMSEAGYR